MLKEKTLIRLLALPTGGFYIIQIISLFLIFSKRAIHEFLDGSLIQSSHYKMFFSLSLIYWKNWEGEGEGYNKYKIITKISLSFSRCLDQLDRAVCCLLHWLLPLLAVVFTLLYWSVGGAVAMIWPQYNHYC